MSTSPRALLRGLLVVLAVLVPSACWGLGTASAEASLGPHLARYEVTLDHEITVDLGPLGTLVIDSPLPFTLGARVVVQEIPREVTAVDDATTLAAVSSDLQGYVQFFTGPQATLEVAVRALVVDAVRRTVLAALLVGGGIALSRAALGPARRGELVRELRPYRAALAGGTVLVLAVAGTVTSSTPLDQGDVSARSASSVFDGTPLEGARITGRLAGIIDTYGGYVVDAYKTNEAFYDGAVAEVRRAWDARVESDERLQAARDAAAFPTALPSRPASPARTPSTGPSARPAVAGSPTGTAAAEGTGAGEGTAAAEGTASPTGTPSPAETAAAAPTPAPRSEPVVMLLVSDLHCNVGMARVIKAVAELSEATIVLNAGDSTINGTAVEQYCVSAFVGAVPDGATMVVSNGNHDSADTADQERRAGARVLDGEVIEIDGIRIFGDSDPNETRIGAGTTLAGQETVSDASRRIAETACAAPDGIDLLLIHNPNVGNTSLAQGCAPAQVSGHLHRRIGPALRGLGVRYVSSSTAGAALDQATVGPLNGVAEMTILRFDPDLRRFIDYRLVRVQPDGEATVGFAVRWPSAPVVIEPDHGPR